MIFAGQLKDYITLQYPAKARDDRGGITETWATVASIWASVEPLAGREYFAAGREISECSTKVRIRYRENVRAAWRATLGNKTWEILSVIDPGNEHKELILMCKEIII